MAQNRGDGENISRKRVRRPGRWGGMKRAVWQVRNFSKIIEMSRSNFSNCKNPDVVVQCALRIDRASRESSWVETRDVAPKETGECTCRLQYRKRERESARERWRESARIWCGSHGSDFDTKTPAKTAEQVLDPNRDGVIW